MVQGKTKKILLTMLLFSLSAIISSSYSSFDLNQKFNAFAQAPSDPSAQTPDPSTQDPDSTADLGAGPIPEDNSTDNLGADPIPEDNSTSLTPPDISSPDITNPENQTDTTLPGDINSTVDNTIPQGTTSSSSAVPEFGPLAGMIITISVIGVIVASRKFRLYL
ncbi:MAG: hypothetical protein KGI28_01295 [Thaumarchaeota archaeon]|nr:hypothetical protein [Nitrososphaerota archaeon]